MAGNVALDTLRSVTARRIAEGAPVITEQPYTLTWATGGPYPHEYKPHHAGRFGCDPCWDCGQSPAAGYRVWMNCYGDLYCDPCAHRNAAQYVAAYPLEQCHGCGESDRHLTHLADGTGQCYRCKLAELLGEMPSD